MIFVTVGSQKFQFNRLLEKIDELIEKGIINDVVAQTGYSTYKPKYFNNYSFLTREEFNDYLAKCDFVITHGGTGAIVTALKSDKKVVAVARLAKYGEHVDDHQLQLIDEFAKLELIEPVNDIKELEEAILKLDTSEYKKYVSNTDAIIESIESFLNSN